MRENHKRQAIFRLAFLCACFAIDPNPQGLVIWHHAKTNETAPDADFRSHDQPVIQSRNFPNFFEKKKKQSLET